jgi:hypothetical protein
MLQQWSAGDDIIRYLTLLTLTATLTGAGLVCGLGIRESNAARTFLALVIASVPIHFAVLGGFVQSQFPLDLAYARNAPWNVDSPITALWLIGLGLVTLLPLTWLSMLALVRQQARRLTWTFIAVNLALLIPLREPDSVAWLVAGMFLLLLILERRIARLGHGMTTGEGVFVRLMMLVPVAIVIGRTLQWYNPSLLFVGLTLLSGALACFELLPKVRGKSFDVQVLQGVCALGAMVGWIVLAIACLEGSGLPEQFMLLVLALPASVLLMVLSVRSTTSGNVYRLAATFLAVGASLVNLMMFWDSTRPSVAGFACLVVGAAFIAYAVHRRRLAPLMSGTIAAICGLVQMLVAAIEVEAFLHWGSLAVTGAILIFVAAVCERHSRRLAFYAGVFQQRVLKWEY